MTVYKLTFRKLVAVTGEKKTMQVESKYPSDIREMIKKIEEELKE